MLTCLFCCKVRLSLTPAIKTVVNLIEICGYSAASFFLPELSGCHFSTIFTCHISLSFFALLLFCHLSFNLTYNRFYLSLFNQCWLCLFWVVIQTEENLRVMGILYIICWLWSSGLCSCPNSTLSGCNHYNHQVILRFILNVIQCSSASCFCASVQTHQCPLVHLHLLCPPHQCGFKCVASVINFSLFYKLRNPWAPYPPSSPSLRECTMG